jgi:hypothetical protein
MSATDFFRYTYVLLAEEVGGMTVLENRIAEWGKTQEVEDYATSPDRFAPDRKLPEAAAENIKAAMALGGQARPRVPNVPSIPDDEVRENQLRQEAADALGDIVERNRR